VTRPRLSPERTAASAPTFACPARGTTLDGTEQVREFVKHLLNVGEHETKVLRVHGYDPVSGGIEPVDLLKQKLLRRVDMEKPSARSKALDTGAAYGHIQDAIREVRETDLPTAAVVF
jgi:hypothetical protein